MGNQARVHGKVHQSVVSAVYYFSATIKPMTKQTTLHQQQNENSISSLTVTLATNR
jgi:hypothetical protein